MELLFIFRIGNQAAALKERYCSITKADISVAKIKEYTLLRLGTITDTGSNVPTDEIILRIHIHDHIHVRHDHIIIHIIVARSLENLPELF